MNGDSSKSRSQSFSRPDNGTVELTDPESIIYESRTSDHITVITPVAPKVLLAVTGSLPSREAPARVTATQDDSNNDNKEDVSSSATSSSSPPALPLPLPPDSDHSEPNGYLEPPKTLLEELGSISEQLSSVLREEMGRMRWPEGA